MPVFLPLRRLKQDMEPMIWLQYFPIAARIAPHQLLEELGIPFEFIKIDKDSGDLDSETY
jgi:glutathione S-transferase